MFKPGQAAWVHQTGWRHSNLLGMVQGRRRTGKWCRGEDVRGGKKTISATLINFASPATTPATTPCHLVLTQTLLGKRIASCSAASTSASVAVAGTEVKEPIDTLMPLSVNPQVLHEGLEEQTLRRIGWDVLNGLKTLHQSGLVYGDMKVGMIQCGSHNIYL